MASKTFSLRSDSTDQITLKWGFNYKNMTVSRNGQPVGEMDGAKELQRGKTFELPGLSTLSIQLKRKWVFIQEMEILLNGQPLPGSDTDPYQQLKKVVNLLLFIAGLNAVLGVLAEISQLDLLLNLGFGIGSLVVGGIFLGLAYLVKKKYSLLSLYGAIGLLALDIVLLFAAASATNMNPSSGLFVKGFFILILANGIQALKRIRNEKEDSLAAQYEAF